LSRQISKSFEKDGKEIAMYVFGEDIPGPAVNIGSQLDKMVVVDERFHLPIVVFPLPIYMDMQGESLNQWCLLT
jgi:hypothetical protein